MAVVLEKLVSEDFAVNGLIVWLLASSDDVILLPLHILFAYRDVGHMKMTGRARLSVSGVNIVLEHFSLYLLYICISKLTLCAFMRICLVLIRNSISYNITAHS